MNPARNNVIPAHSFDVPISEDHRTKLKLCRASIVENMGYKDIMDNLIVCEILDDKFRQELETSGKPNYKQIEELLDYIADKTEWVYYSFVWALKAHYDWLYKECKSLCPHITYILWRRCYTMMYFCGVKSYHVFAIAM